MADIKLTLVVACALVDVDKRVLIAQRPEGKALAGLWEFPGGKIEPGERPEQTLIRELAALGVVLAGLAGIEPDVLEDSDLAICQLGSDRCGRLPHRIGGETNRLAENFAQSHRYR